MPTISVGSIDQVIFAQAHGVRMSGLLEYNGQLYGISQSKNGAYVSDYAYECPGFTGWALPPSQTNDGKKLTAALQGKSASAAPIKLTRKDLQQLMRSGADFSKTVIGSSDTSDR